jgi:hypothetical protein
MFIFVSRYSWRPMARYMDLIEKDLKKYKRATGRGRLEIPPSGNDRSGRHIVDMAGKIRGRYFVKIWYE